jgi:hypothetical protein
MARPKPPPPRPQLRAGDVVVLRQSQESIEGEIIAVLMDGRYKVRWPDSGRPSEPGDEHHGRGSQEELAGSFEMRKRTTRKNQSLHEALKGPLVSGSSSQKRRRRQP